MHGVVLVYITMSYNAGIYNQCLISHMCDSKSASDEEKEEATLSPRLSGNQHLMLSKYI